MRQERHPFLLVEDLSGDFKPLFHRFTQEDGLSTMPIRMLGHADDTLDGKLYSCEAAIVRRKREQLQQVRASLGPSGPMRPT